MKCVAVFPYMAELSAGGRNCEPVRSSLGANGRVVIPAAMREELGLKPGDPIVMEVEDGVLRIESFLGRLGKIQDEIIQLVGPDRSLADELIAERREESHREQEESIRKPHLGGEIRKAG